MKDPARIVWCGVAVLFALAAAIHIYIGISMPQWWPWLIAAPCVLAAVGSWREAMRDDQEPTSAQT